MAEKKDALEQALADITKKFGKGSVMVLGESKPITHNLLSTGSLLIDDVLGGGIGYGRITEVYGVESSGKSTLCLQLAAQCQASGGTVAYIDVENAMDPNYAKHLGVDVNKLIFSQPDSGEQALEIAEILVKSGKVNLIIVDSVAALTPQAELNGEIGDAHIGLLARLMSQAMRRLASVLHNTNCAMVFINQIREKVSTTGVSYGNNETTTGGRALKFYASQRIELKKDKSILRGTNEIIGNGVKVRIVKNKIAPPMRSCIVPMIYGDGFSAESEVIDLAIEHKLITAAGSWFTTHDGQRMQGKDAVRAYYTAYPEKASDLREKVKEVLFGNTETIEEEPTTLSDDEIANIIVNDETGEIIE